MVDAVPRRKCSHVQGKIRVYCSNFFQKDCAELTLKSPGFIFCDLADCPLTFVMTVLRPLSQRRHHWGRGITGAALLHHDSRAGGGAMGRSNGVGSSDDDGGNSRGIRTSQGGGGGREAAQRAGATAIAAGNGGNGGDDGGTTAAASGRPEDIEMDAGIAEAARRRGTAQAATAATASGRIGPCRTHRKRIYALCLSSDTTNTLPEYIGWRDLVPPPKYDSEEGADADADDDYRRRRRRRSHISLEASVHPATRLAATAASTATPEPPPPRLKSTSADGRPPRLVVGAQRGQLRGTFLMVVGGALLNVGQVDVLEDYQLLIVLSGRVLLRFTAEFYIPVESTSIHYLKTRMCIGCLKGFEILDLESLEMQGLLDPF
ncbi:hypothetical protein B0H14DRAFT_3617894 [Mycena olivaceomarginata]|nr:hypothetical protein B0H14DRAFT_3617894 [Mycena olivaceomarginata]